jgi:NTP pyrophosphatase (non-canonical NTP hydrolase)
VKSAINSLTREDVERFRTLESDDNYGSSLTLYQKMATRSAIYPGQGTPLGLAYVALKMNGEAGEFAEHVGKAMRDDGLICDGSEENDHYGSPLTPERRTLLVKEVGDVLWYLSAACNELGITLSQAALINLEKLADRSERNALRGSGDNR